MQKEKEVWRTAQFISKNSSKVVFTGYQISNFGRVMSLNYNNTKKPKIMTPGRIKKSIGTYYYVTLRRDKKKYDCTIHRLVLSSFKPHEYFEGAVVDHINSNPSDNHLSNLRWVTQQVNSSTPHLKESLSKAHTNHLSKSKQVKVTFLNDGHSEIFPSASEASRALSLPLRIAATYINQHSGFYKKLNVLFEYI